MQQSFPFYPFARYFFFFFVLASNLNELHCVSQIRSYRHRLLAVTSRLCADSAAPGVSGSQRLLRNRKKLSATENAIYILKHFQFLMHRRRRSMSRRQRGRIKLRQRQQHKTHPIHSDHFQIFKTFLGTLLVNF